MVGFDTSEWVSRRPQEVFDFITTPGIASRIVSSVTNVVKITDGPIGVGTRFRETRLTSGREEQVEVEVAAYEPNQAYAVKNVTEGIETVYRYTFLREADGTSVDLVCEVTASGAKRLLLPLVVAELKRIGGGHLPRVKKALES
jgi:hypothetical protein